MSDQPNPPTKEQYYNYLVRLNRHLGEIRTLFHEIGSHSQTRVEPPDEFEDALSTIRSVVAAAVAASIDYVPGV